MAGHASKRRKLEHASSEEEVDDSASFASFEDLQPSDQEGEDDFDDDAADIDLDDEESEGMDDGESDGDESAAEGDVDMKDARSVQATEKASNTTKTASKSNPSANGHGSASVSRSSSYATGTFKSNMFKLQVDELLEQIRPRHGKREVEAEAILHKIKQAIERIPAREGHPAGDAERAFQKGSKVKIPFPHPPPAADAKYKLAYSRPSGINVVGSHALKTASRARKTCEIDMIVIMPAALFQEKDYLDYRYLYKRSYYLACIAAGLEESASNEADLRFNGFHDNPLQPILELTPKVKAEGANAAPKWQINIIACAAEGTFPPEKLLPKRSNVRPRQSTPSERTSDDSRVATPHYNSTLRSEMIMTSYLQLLDQAAKTCDAFRDACLLSSTWLRQRGFSSDIHDGGFGGFELSTLMALLLQGGASGGRPVLSDRYTSYQLLKATLQILAMKDVKKQPLVIGNDTETGGTFPTDIPVVWDGERNHNLLYKMTLWSYKALRQEAKTTLSILADTTFDAFDSIFIFRADCALYRYDYVVELDEVSLRVPGSHQDHLAQVAFKKLYEVLTKGLGDRAQQVNIIPPSTSPWPLIATRPTTPSKQKISIGITVDPDTVNRAIDHGPSAERKTEAAAFRKFWGDKAELRRFRDGSIHETLVWSNDSRDSSILEQIIRHVLRQHLGQAVEQTVAFIGGACTKLLRQAADNSAFSSLMNAFKQLETDIRGLDDLPLSVRQLSAADPQLRYSSVDLKPPPADIVLQFEGSTRWPDELVAIQRTKIAFLLKLSQQIEDSVNGVSARIGLENEDNDILNQAFLEVVYESGAAFRIRIHHDREQALLDRRLKDKSIEPAARDAAVHALSKYKQDYLVSPAHTQAFAGLCSRFPALSGTVRLLKQWFASHLLCNHVSDEVVELIVARIFVQPWPWQAPSSVQTGFYRTLNWLSRWDWRHDPLIVDLGGDGSLKEAERQIIATNFEAWRKIDPALNRVVLFAASNVDPSGTTWTDGRPLKVVAGRMTALAKAARTEIEARQLDLDPASLFASPLADFDFVLHLDPTLLNHKRRRSKQGSFKNLELQLDDADTTSTYQPLAEFTFELERTYSSAALFFSGGKERPVIAGLWNPQTAPRTWTLSNLTYSSIPRKGAEGEKTKADINKDAILAEMARLGGELLRRVEVMKK